jgi:adenosylhomocysteine nucleosidase
MSGTVSPPSAGRVDVGIVFALAIEADAFGRCVADHVELRAAGLVFHEGTTGGRRVAWCVGGVGADAAARAARLLVDGHRPGLLVSAGFAGGLDPALARGTLVRPTHAVDEAGNAPLPLMAAGAAPAAGPVTICTVRRIVRSPAEKRALAAATGAALVDMETHAVAGVAAAAGLPCAGVRVVSDDATQALPREVTALAAPQSAWRRFGAAVGGLARRPGAAVDLWRLWEHAVVDGRTLAAGLAETSRSVASGSGA